MREIWTVILAVLLTCSSRAANEVLKGTTAKTGVVETAYSNLTVTNQAGVVLPLLSTAAYRAEFRYLRRECRHIDLQGSPIPTDGWTDNIPDVEWPYMQFAYFGFACVNLAQCDAASRSEALAEARWLIDALQTPRLSGFMTPNFGEPFGKDKIHASAFVHGLFLNLTLRYRTASGDQQYDALIHRVVAALSNAYTEHDQAILGSYKTMWWLTDNFPAMSALKRYDQVFQRETSRSAERLVKSIKSFYLDSRTGLFCTFIEPFTHRKLQGPRGVSVMYGLHFLKDFAPAFAVEQYALAKKHLFRPILGLMAVREFPEGAAEEPDVASGPIIFGLGPAASGFAIAAAVINDDQITARELIKASVLVGQPQFTGDELAYAMMPPVGQAVILFGKTELLRK